MAISYAIRKVKNPSKNAVEGVNYYHAAAIKAGEYNFEDMMSDISHSTTVTEADAMAVLRSMKSHIVKALLSGQVVVLQDIGRFQVTLQGKCYSQDAMAASDFSPSAQITGHKIIFRPEVKLKQSVAAGISLKRVTTEAA